MLPGGMKSHDPLAIDADLLGNSTLMSPRFYVNANARKALDNIWKLKNEK
jgi:hypothetical protein